MSLTSDQFNKQDIVIISPEQLQHHPHRSQHLQILILRTHQKRIRSNHLQPTIITHRHRFLLNQLRAVYGAVTEFDSV